MKESVKEVWIKFDSQSEYSENEERLFALLDERPGDSVVKVYDASTKGCKELRSRSFDEAHISILTDAFGKDNVRLTTKTVRAKSRSDIIECCGNCIERIADALEKIADALEGGKPDEQ